MLNSSPEIERVSPFASNLDLKLFFDKNSSLKQIEHYHFIRMILSLITSAYGLTHIYIGTISSIHMDQGLVPVFISNQFFHGAHGIGSLGRHKAIPAKTNVDTTFSITVTFTNVSQVVSDTLSDQHMTCITLQNKPELFYEEHRSPLQLCPGQVFFCPKKSSTSLSSVKMNTRGLLSCNHRL